MANYIVIFLLVTMVYGMGKSTIGKGITKRSGTLLHDVMQKMVAEEIKRHKILEKFSEIKNEFSSIKHKLLAVTTKLWKNIKLHENASKAELRDTKKEIGEMKKKSSKQFQATQKAITVLLNKTSELGQQVAFTATLLTHTTTSSAIVFNNVITNIGDGYNNRDGMFHCPRSGLYLFSATVTAYQNIHVVGFLMKNHKQMARTHENSGRNAYPSASLTAVLRLTTGDKIWIKGYGIKYYAPYNAFTGVLIKPET